MDIKASVQNMWVLVEYFKKSFAELIGKVEDLGGSKHDLMRLLEDVEVVRRVQRIVFGEEISDLTILFVALQETRREVLDEYKKKHSRVAAQLSTLTPLLYESVEGVKDLFAHEILTKGHLMQLLTFRNYLDEISEVLVHYNEIDQGVWSVSSEDAVQERGLHIAFDQGKYHIHDIKEPASLKAVHLGREFDSVTAVLEELDRLKVQPATLRELVAISPRLRQRQHFSLAVVGTVREADRFGSESFFPSMSLLGAHQIVEQLDRGIPRTMRFLVKA
jgi:hypothetical protein